jgi:hypothetical protein
VKGRENRFLALGPESGSFMVQKGERFGHTFGGGMDGGLHKRMVFGPALLFRIVRRPAFFQVLGVGHPFLNFFLDGFHFGLTMRSEQDQKTDDDQTPIEGGQVRGQQVVEEIQVFGEKHVQKRIDEPVEGSEPDSHDDEWEAVLFAFRHFSASCEGSVKVRICRLKAHPQRQGFAQAKLIRDKTGTDTRSILRKNGPGYSATILDRIDRGSKSQ